MARERRPDTRTWEPAADGLVVVDKPAGWTSHDVVGRLRYLARTRKVGHAGTLDPMATGVLVVGIGRATRLLTYLVGADKDYRATIRLGEATVTEDAEGERTAAAGAEGLDPAAVERELLALTGDLEQVPSAVSAIKVDGERSYARVRAGQDVRLAARPVTVSRFAATGLRPATTSDGVPVLDVDAEVTCSSGTYVRALARDLGDRLGVGGHLTALRRTRVGGFTLDRARTLDELGAETEAGRLPVVPLARAAAAVFPVRDLDDAETAALGHGRGIEPTGASGLLAAIGPDGALVALVEDRDDHGTRRARPTIVFAPS